MRTTHIARLAALVVVLAAAGCRTTHIGAETPQRYRNLVDQGAPVIEDLDPQTAGILNLGPGLGDLYTERPMIALANAFLWPLSCIWSMGSASERARTINQQLTVDYYLTGEGAGKFDPDMRAADGPGAIRAATPARVGP